MTLYCQTDGPFGEVYRYGTISVLQDLGERGQWLTIRHPPYDGRETVNDYLWREADPVDTPPAKESS